MELDIMSKNPSLYNFGHTPGSRKGIGSSEGIEKPVTVDYSQGSCLKNLHDNSTCSKLGHPFRSAHHKLRLFSSLAGTESTCKFGDEFFGFPKMSELFLYRTFAVHTSFQQLRPLLTHNLELCLPIPRPQGSRYEQMQLHQIIATPRSVLTACTQFDGPTKVSFLNRFVQPKPRCSHLNCLRQCRTGFSAGLFRFVGRRQATEEAQGETKSRVKINVISRTNFLITLR